MSTLSPRFFSARSASSAALPAQLPTGIGSRPFETTRSTIVPKRSVVPPLGSEAMTMPSGTVSENSLVVLPKAMLAVEDPVLRLVLGDPGQLRQLRRPPGRGRP